MRNKEYVDIFNRKIWKEEKQSETEAWMEK